MDLLSVFKADNQRMFGTQILPGALAFWPFAFMILDAHKIDIDLSREWESIMLILIYLFLSAGVGILIEDIGSLFEVQLESIYFKIKTMQHKPPKHAPDPFMSVEAILNLIRHLLALPIIIIPHYRVRDWLLGNYIEERQTDKKASEIHTAFYKTWDAYLTGRNTQNVTDSMILKYYKDVLVRFKFELNTSAALIAMLLGHFILTTRSFGIKNIWHSINPQDSALYILLIVSIISVLIMEAFKGIELLDSLRRKLTQIGSPTP
jgi:hypothetical protein